MDSEGRGLRDAGFAGVLLFVCGTAYACATDETPAISPAYVAGLTAEAAEASNPLAAFTPEAPVFPSSGTVNGTYTVVGQGETLYGIANRLGVSPADLAQANGITNINLVFAGSALRIPKPGLVPSLPNAGHATNKITIKYGDTLSGLATQYGTNVAAIKSANGLTNDVIYAGSSLNLP